MGSVEYAADTRVWRDFTKEADQAKLGF